MDTMTGMTWSKRPSYGLLIAAVVEIVVSIGLIIAAFMVPAARSSLLITGVILLMLGIGLAFLARKSMARYAEAQRLKTTGLQVLAAIVGMTQTGVYMNEQPQVQLNLQVQVEGREPYTVTKKEYVPMMLIGTLTSGRPLPVSVDPANPQNVVINWEMAGAASQFVAPGQPGAPAPGQGPIVGKDIAATPELIAQGAAQGMLPTQSQMEAKRARLRAEGKPGTAVVQSAQPTGQSVGSYSIVVVDLVVTIDGQTKDIMAAGAAVPAALVGNVRQGMVVPIRVDPNDPDEMTILWEEAKPPTI